MDRQLMLHLQAGGCAAQAVLNGIPVARVSAACPRVSLPVHEFTQAGQNRLELMVDLDGPLALAPERPQPRLVKHAMGASLSLQLQACDSGDASQNKVLAQQDWAPAQGSRFQAPLSLGLDVQLPVSFPRWRWLDAPLIELTPALQLKVLDWLQTLAVDLGNGQFEGYLTACALRVEELSLAYQLKRDEQAGLLQAQLQQMHADDRLQWQDLSADQLWLRPVAGGRLLECLDRSGAPALRTVADPEGQVALFPLRVAVVESRLYVLR